MKFQATIIVAFFTFFLSCKTPPQNIIPTDFESILAKAKTDDGITEEEADSISYKIINELKLNTEEKKLPDIKVTDLENREVKLQDQITGKTIILSSDMHCAMAFECLSNEYPKAMKGLSKNYQIAPTICLVIKIEYDEEDEVKFNTAVAQLKPFYQKLYIINENEARKINLHYASCRLYLNKEKIVENMEFGHCTADKLGKEISQNSI